MKHTGTLGGDLRGNLPSPSVIALTDAPGNRKPIKSLTEGKYLKVEDGFIVCDTPSGSSTDDHKVSVNQTDEDNGDADYLEIKITGDGSTTTSEVVNGSHGKKVVIHAIPPIPPTYVDDHKVAVDSSDNAAGTADFLYNKLSSPNSTISRTRMGGTNPSVGLDVFCSRETPKPSVAGGNPGTGSHPPAWDHQHPLESPAVTGSYLYPVKRVSYGPSTVNELPVITYPTQKSVTVTYEDLATHSHDIIVLLDVFPDDSRYFLTGFTATVNQEFAGSGLEHLYFYTKVDRNYVLGGAHHFDGIEYLIPSEAARSVAYPDGFDLVGAGASTEYSASEGLSIQFAAQNQNGTGLQSPDVSFESFGCLLDGLVAGSITFTFYYELRQPANAETTNRQMLIDAPGSNDVVSKSITVPSPFTPNSGLLLNSLKLIIGNMWKVPDGVDGNITVKCETVTGQTVFSPIDIRQKYADVVFEFTGLLTPLYQDLILTFERDSGTIQDILDGSFRLEYGVTQFNTPDPEVLGYNALTASQVADNTTEPFTVEQEISSAGEVLVGEIYTTLSGTPGIASIPAEEHTFGILGAVDLLDLTASNKWRIKCAVWRDGQGSPDSPYLVADGPNMFNQVLSVSEISGTPLEVVNLSAADRLVFSIYAVTDKSTGFTFTFAQNAELSSWFRLPFSMGSFGTLDHQQLTATSRGFTVGEAAAVTYRHPMVAIEPGFITWNTGPVVATVDGLLTLPPKTNAVRISGTDTFLGIETTGITPGTVIYVEMSEARMVANNSTPPDGYASFDFHNAFGCSASPWAFYAKADSPMVLELQGSSTWRVLSASWVVPQLVLWPTTCSATINTTNASGLLVLPVGCPGVVYVTGTALRAITYLDSDGYEIAGPLASLKLHFLNDCTLYHNDPLTGWDAGLAARAAKLDLLPPDGATGDDLNFFAKEKRTLKFILNTLDINRTWLREIEQ